MILFVRWHVICVALHAYAEFLDGAPTTPAGPAAQHNRVKLALAEMTKAEANDGNDADDERKAWMDSKKAVKLAKNANDKMDNIREASVAKAKANEDAAM